MRGVVAACAALAAVASRAEPPAPLPSRIVLVTIDTLRADAAPMDGSPGDRAPYLTSLAQGGIAMTAAYAPSSWTPPSMASLFTSLHPASHGVVGGVVRRGDVHEQPVLADAVETLAESLKAAGYRTIGVPSNRHLQRSLGFAQGFDAYFGEAEFLRAGAVNLKVRQLLGATYGDGWRERYRTGRTFLWIHYFDPHDPYVANAPYVRELAPDFDRERRHFHAGLAMSELRSVVPSPRGEERRRLRALYDSEVRYVDAQLHALSAELLLEDPGTLLVVTSDHGEEIGDHGSLGHAHTLHEELLRVPMLFRWPAAIPEGGRRDVPVSLLDVMPTLEELVGRGRPGRQGRSLWPLLRRAGALPVLPMLFQLHAPRPALRGMRLGDHKLIEDVGAARCGAEALALYDLARDPAEERDLGAEDPALAQELAARMSAFFASLPASPEPSRQEVDDGTLEELRSLGYVGP